ncbi:MAG: hypothetical protein CMK59_13190 [Proteobacteria bacterium]|nr:hypothetical protein [Pseudomonadota bacterium]
MKKLGIVNRPLWVGVPFILALLPFAEALHTGQALGTGADFITTTWAMWWFSQEWLGAAWGGHSVVFNFPYGGQGAILSPISAFTWMCLEPILGISGATTGTALSSVWLMLGALLWLGRGLNFSLLSCGCLMMAFLVPRYFLYTLGETGPVGVAALPLVLGCGALVWRDRIGGFAWLLIGSIALQGLENPYLAPILPLVALWFMWKKPKDYALLLGGIVLLGLVGILYHGASAKNYESIRPTAYLQIASLYFPEVERPWARAAWLDFLWPKQIVWPLGGLDSIHMAGRETVGWTVFLGAICAPFVDRQRSWLWLFLFLCGLILASGSNWGGHAAPFAWFNSICSLFIRPLTQPTRYLVITALGGAVLMGVLCQRIIKRNHLAGVALYLALVLESLFLGGLSLRIPSTDFPEAECITELRNKDGGVLIWPWDGMDDLRKDATLYSRKFQMAHGRPGATIGTGSWPLVGDKFPGHWLRQHGWREALEERGSLDKEALIEMGYRWVIVDLSAPTMMVTRGKERVFGPAAKLDACEGAEIYQLNAN